MLSEATAEVDLGDKPGEYLSLPTVSDYLVISEDGPKGWYYRRGAGPAPHTLRGRDVVVEIASLGAKLSFDSLYRGFPDWVEPEGQRRLKR